jgi:uncharacterized MnhB-related membrane protein
VLLLLLLLELLHLKTEGSCCNAAMLRSVMEVCIAEACTIMHAAAAAAAGDIEAWEVDTHLSRREDRQQH